MTEIDDKRAILAVDPGTRDVAFVFFENGRLLDWGKRGRGRDELQVLDELIDRLRAEVLVLEDPDAIGCERRPRLRRVLRTMVERARSRGVAVKKVSRYSVRLSWREQGRTTKHTVGEAIATMFPEMAPFVPRARRRWDIEDPRSGVRDAFSLLLHVFKTENGEAAETATSRGLRASA
jgi:5S rRNA maturation endonuclease (ribonuclease M5)